MRHDSRGILYIDEIAQLHAVFIAGLVAFEQLYRAGLLELVEAVQCHARHALLVVFIRTVYVKKLKSAPLRRCRQSMFYLVQCPLVEKLLGVAIAVQRAQCICFAFVILCIRLVLEISEIFI